MKDYILPGKGGGGPHTAMAVTGRPMAPTNSKFMMVCTEQNSQQQSHKFTRDIQTSDTKCIPF